MYSAKIVALSFLVIITPQLQANAIKDTVQATRECVEQVYSDVTNSELGVACVHTWEHFQAWVAQRPLQAGTAAGVMAFIACYWLSKRHAEHRSMCQQNDAYNEGFEDGCTYVYQSYSTRSIYD